MSKYAKINSENIVENVIVCEDSQIGTQSGDHIKVTDITRDAVLGGSYDSINNKFINLKPYQSWVLGEDFNWQSPIGAKPEDGDYEWNEEDASWVKLTPGTLNV
jgi:hypothetical protein